ncbi:MAG: complex I subunit 5 family protein [Candidatus Methanomethylicaceae archaeon]
MLPLISPVLLVAGSIVAPLAFKRGSALASAVASFFVLALVVNSWLIINIGEGSLFYPSQFGVLVNRASAFVVELALFLGLLGSMYAYKYFDERVLRPFYFLYSLFLATLVMMASSFNILIMYVSFEASTIAGGILILFTRRRSATKAALRFFLLSVTGAIIILIGILYQNSLTGSSILSKEVFYRVANSDLVLLSALYALGFGIKVGVFPFGLLWLPAAHSEAPTPVSAILSGVMVQIAAFSVSRVIGTISPTSDILATSIITMGAVSVLLGAVLAAVEATVGSKYSRFHVGAVNIRSLKRIWAFSTTSEVGVFYILVGLALLLPHFSTLFFAGILLHLLNHGMAKALLFFDSGFVIEESQVADLSLLKGLGRRVGVNAITYIFGGLSLSLFPGTFGYNAFLEFTKGHAPLWATAAVFMAAPIIFFTTIYSLWIIISGRPKVKIEYINGHKHAHPSLRIPSVILTILILVLGMVVLLSTSGILPEPYQHFEDWINSAAKTLVEPWVGGA